MAEVASAVVIGGTSGIGKAIALRLARAGAQVIVAGRDAVRGEAVAAEATRLGAPLARFVAVDVAEPDQIEALGRRVEDAMGIPEVVVNCAGILQSGKHVLDQDLAEDERMWRINYRGTLVGAQVFGRMMKRAGRGAILNVGSLASFAPLSLPSYTPGKQAVQALTGILAAELGPHGIRVNAVAPGYTLSDGLQARIAAGERDPDAILDTTALKKFVAPEDVAEAALFLCSPRAASITGVTLPVDAGWLVQAPYAHYLRGNPIRKGQQDE